MLSQSGSHQRNTNQDVKQLQIQNNQSLFKVPQHLVMQNLTHFFLAPSSKQMPYLYFFTKDENWPIYALTYLYNFIRSSHHSKIINQNFEKIIPLSKGQNEKKTPQTVQRIIQSRTSGPVSIKILLARYIGLPSVMGQHLSRKKINITGVQSLIVQEVSGILQKLDQQERIYIINKLITLGHSEKLIQSTNRQTILQNYHYITKRETIIFAFLKQIVEKNTTLAHQLQKIVEKYHSKQSFQTIVRILHQSYFNPHHSVLVYSQFKNHNQLLMAIFEDLLVWWADGNDHYLIYNSVKFRTNLMALIIKDMEQNKVINYSGQLSLGVQRRLVYMVESKKEVVTLIMGLLANRMGLKMEFKDELLKTTETPKENHEIKAQYNETDAVQNKNSEDQEGKETQVEQQQKRQDQVIDFSPKPPKNLYDCILGLRNPARRSITLKLMPKIIRSNPDDLVFVWKELVTELFYNLDENQQSVISVFVARPEPFIDFVGSVFFTKENSLNDKILLMGILSKGVQQLSHEPKEVEKGTLHQQFYFKKVTSKYYKDNDSSNNEKDLPKIQSRTRRWGHTRIAHEKKLLQQQNGLINLKIVKNDPYINRLYEIANHLFFRIISKLALLPIFPSQQMFTRSMLQLLATLSANLKNHIQKYKILSEVVQSCLRVIEYIEENGRKVNGENKRQYLKKWKDTNMAVLQTLNKISLAIDQYTPNVMLEYLEKCLLKLKSSQQYGINPIVNMIEANIYTNVSGQKLNF